MTTSSSYDSTYSRYIGRVGALAAALGIGVMVASFPSVANADPSGTSSESSGASSAADASASASDTGTTDAADTAGDSSPPSKSSAPSSSGADSAATSDSADAAKDVEDLDDGASPQEDAAEEDSDTDTEEPADTDTDTDTEESVPTAEDTPSASPADSSRDIDDNVEEASAPTGGDDISATFGTVEATQVTSNTDHDTVPVSATAATSDDHEAATLSAAESADDVAVETAAATTTTEPVSTAAAAIQTGPLAFVSSFVAALSPLLAPPPSTPAQSPLLWGVLAWVRRNFFNQAPRINYNPVQTVQIGQIVTGNIGATDAEGDALTYKITQAPEHGTLTIDQATGEFTYTPDDTDYTSAQSDSFSVSVRDGKFNLLSFWSPRTDQETIGVTVRLGADYVDPLYNNPVIDTREDVTAGAVSYHKVVGHFAGTDKKFTIYLPPADQWKGRFFQNVYPLDNENAEEEDIAFGAASGAYIVKTNGGGGFRVDAAAAKFAKTIAADYYDYSDRIYGYVWGASGGSFQTIGAIENTVGVWDGAVPIVIANPTSFLNWNIRAMARLVLADKVAQIADAVSPGGSGDPYAGLDEAERAVLREVTNMGIPLRTFENYHWLLDLDGPTPENLYRFAATARALDPTYADDFWSKRGYLGTEQSALGDFYRAAKIDHSATVTTVDRDGQGTPLRLTVDTVPANPEQTPFDLTVYSPDGAIKYGLLSGTLDPATGTITLGADNNADVLAALDAGARIRIDNRWSLALTAYARHQVPDASGGFAVYDHYRAPDGRPLYPQRPVQLSPQIASSVIGAGTYTGNIAGKVIVVHNLVDADSFSWPGHWYSTRVQNALGDQYDDNFRLWYNDNADHIASGRTENVINYSGIVQRALRDLSAWVERGEAPAQSTRYTVADGQVHVPADATDRRGIQPVVHLTANGTDHVEVTAGQRITFRANIEVPPDAGRVTGLEWDPTGTGSFIPLVLRPESGSAIQVTHTFTYDQPGTYFAALRVTAHDDADPSTEYAGVENLGRVRVVVR